MLALLSFVATVGLAGLSVMDPKVLALRMSGTPVLFCGLLLIAVAVCLCFVELILSRQVIRPELEDFKDLIGGSDRPTREPQQRAGIAGAE